MKPVRVLLAQLNKAKAQRSAAAGNEKVETEAANKERQLISQLYAESAAAKVDAVKDYLGTVLEADCKERQLISQLYAESAAAKVDAVKDYLGTVLEADCKFLVFAHHMSMMDGLEEFFKKERVGFIRIDGKTATEHRQQLVNSFQTHESVKVALLAIHAAGVGLTLTAGSTVVFTEMAWNPGDLVQAEDRAHRIGQENSVNIYYLHAPETVDDLIWSVVQHKLENLGQVMDGEQHQKMQVAGDVRKKGGRPREGSQTNSSGLHVGEKCAIVSNSGSHEEKRKQLSIKEAFFKKH
eukprot:TRINITY_DN15314_c0_g1_i2.p1 TRINITY_DN15314_c0_g1~~TRINITY_DN15314_c0_g1_i2.p1  ORF type:complete len:319 (+),score=39.81 TRINITY_DN15314_c0_g1_i2:73-957(+)